MFGCDAMTELEIDLTDEEVEVFIKICKELNKNSEYRCQPTIALYKYDECEIVQFDEDETYISTDKAKDLLEKGKEE